MSALEWLRPSPERSRELVALALLALGLSQLAGRALGLEALTGLGIASCAAPAPKVFTSARGLETYASRYVLEWRDGRGVRHERVLDRALAARLRGPYNRRNVYGALLAYGPVLLADERSRPMARAGMRAALTGRAPLLRELGFDPEDTYELRLRVIPSEGSAPEGLELCLELSCD